MVKVQFRPATEDDLEFVYRVREAAFRPHVETWDETRARRDLARWFIEEEFSIVIGDGSPIGYLALSRREETWTVHQLVILPESQGQGYGARAVALLLVQARSIGRTVRLRVRKSNARARTFYTRMGFVAEGETESHESVVWQPPEPIGLDVVSPLSSPSPFGREFLIGAAATVVIVGIGAGLGNVWESSPLLPPFIGLVVGSVKIALGWREREPGRRWATQRFAPWMWPPLGTLAAVTLFHFGQVLWPSQGEDHFYIFAFHVFSLTVWSLIGLFVGWLGGRR